MSPAAAATGEVPDPAWRSYWEALSRGDSAAAVRVALGVRAEGVALVDVIDRLVAPGQAEVGRLWAANQWNVAQEHRATSVSEEVVAALAAGVPAGASKGVAVVTCVDGEWHALPSRLVAAVLREAGWEVQFLGASVPVSQLAQFLQDSGPDVTALSCSVPSALPRARRMIEASRDVGVPVIVGGAGFGPAGRWGLKLGANGTAPDARRAAEVLSSAEWPSYTDAAPPVLHPDRSPELLRRARRQVVGSAYARLLDRWPETADYDDWQRERTEEDLGHLVDFLAAALYVDEADLYTSFIAWMAAVLEARQVPRAAMAAGIEVVSEAVAEVLGEQPRAQRFLSAALSV